MAYNCTYFSSTIIIRSYKRDKHCHNNIRVCCSSFRLCLKFLRFSFLSPKKAASKMTLSNDIDLLHPPADVEKRKHKRKRLVQTPNSFFMDVKCQGCSNITTMFSHSQTVVVCVNCHTVLCQPTGGRARLIGGHARLMEGSSFRRKND